MTVMKDKNHGLSLVESIKNNIRKEDRVVASYLDFNKTDEVIIADMIAAGLLKIKKTSHVH